MKSLLLLCHTLQEFVEWRAILNELAKDCPFRLRVLPTWEFDCAYEYDLAFDPRIEVIPVSLGFNPRSLGMHFRRLNNRKKLSILRAMKPNLRSALEGVDLVSCGATIIFPRYLYQIRKPNQVFVSLLRSLFLPLRENTTVLAKRRLMRGLTRCVGLDYLISPTAGIGYTDYYLTIGQLNREYLELNEIDRSAIRIIGAPALDNLVQHPRASSIDKHTKVKRASGDRDEVTAPIRVCFLSQAFGYHHFHDEEQEQNRCIEEFLESYSTDRTDRPTLEVHVKLHPRDKPDRYAFLGQIRDVDPVTVHSQPMGMQQTRDSFDLFISWTSTLALEMIAGNRPALFVAGPRLRHSYGLWFEKLGIEPLADGNKVYEVIKTMYQNSTSPQLSPQMMALSKRVFSNSTTQTAAQRGAQALLTILNTGG